MNWKDLIKPPPAEGYIKNSSNLVTALLVLAGILYYPTNGYGAVIALIAALIVLIGQKMLIAQTNKDFTEMQLAEKQFQETQNSDTSVLLRPEPPKCFATTKSFPKKAKKSWRDYCLSSKRI